MKKVIIIGSGAVASYINYILSYSSEYEVIGYTDIDETKKGQLNGDKPILGTDKILTELRKEGVNSSIIAIGNPFLRNKIKNNLDSLGYNLINAIHPSVILHPEVKLGKGIIIEAGCIFSNNIIINDNVFIGLGVKILHDVTIGENCLIGGGSLIGAYCNVGKEVLVGSGAVIQMQKSIGNESIIATGACVMHDVKPKTTVAGNPARVIKSE